MDLSTKAADTWQYYSLLSPLAAVGVNVVMQVILVRARRGGHFLRSIIEGFFIGAFAFGAIEAFLVAWRGASGDSLITSLLVNAPTYAALSYCYFAVVNLGQTSIRIRIYSELATAPDGISIQEIEGIYDEGALMEMRLQRLLESGDIIEREGRYFIGRKKLLLVANIIFAAKHILLGKKSEFE